MPKSVLHLTPPVFYTLLALSEEPRHGYEISQSTEEASLGKVKMGPGTLYGTLQRMQVAGLLKEVAAPQGAEGPHRERRRYYAVTEAGRQALVAESERLEKAVSLLRQRGFGPSPRRSS
ncbi:MAG: PadR family transcriptional regulator [Acidobacteriota bacterium]